ncbi:MAG: hypothetical protein R8K53_03180 [Mariprofundaceae bacterium]
MPDIGLFELILIGVLLFMVVGPERMPEFFSQIGRWVRLGRGWMGQFREDLQRETVDIVEPLADAKKEMQQQADSIKDGIELTARDLSASVQEQNLPDSSPDSDSDAAIASGKTQDK